MAPALAEASWALAWSTAACCAVICRPKRWMVACCTAIWSRAVLDRKHVVAIVDAGDDVAGL